MAARQKKIWVFKGLQVLKKASRTTLTHPDFPLKLRSLSTSLESKHIFK